MAKKQRWTEGRVAALVGKLYPAGAYAYLTSVRNGTGYQRSQDRTADALAVSCWPSRGLYLIGFEIKVSRSDWRKELGAPRKSIAIQAFCRYWYVAAPTGVVPIGEVPDNWGLIECGRSAAIVKQAPQLDEKPLDKLMMCSILRRFSESVVPIEHVQSRIEEASEKAREAAREETQYRLNSLERTIADFERASGVSLVDQMWAAGDIGAAVRIVREHGPETAVQSTRRIAGEHRAIAERLEGLLSELVQNDE